MNQVRRWIIIPLIVVLALMCCSARAAFEQIASVNTSGCASDAKAWVLSEERYALCTASGVYIIGTDQTNDEARELTVCGGGLIDVNELYQSAYPEVKLNTFTDEVDMSTLAERMASGDRSADIYRVKVDYSFQMLRQKRYAATLDESQILTEEAESFSEKISNLVTNEDGVLIAWPAALNISQFGINKGYWEMVFGDRELPQTVNELMDDWLLWERDYADEYPDIDMWFGFDLQELCQKFVAFYFESYDDMTNATASLNQVLRPVLEKLVQIYEIRKQSGRTTEEWTTDEEDGRGTILSLFAPRKAMYRNKNYYLNVPENMVYDISVFAYSTVYLKWKAEDEEKTSADLYVLIINPYSENKDLALHYLECAARIEASPYLYYATHDGYDEPYERENYQEKVEAIQTEIAELEEILQAEDLEQNDREYAEATLEYDQTLLNEQENLRYLITSETIATDRDLLAKADYGEDNIYLYALENSDVMSELCERFAAGNLTVDAFLNELTGKLKMIAMEYQ